MNGNDYAVVVGIGGYPLLPPLRGPENDADDFVDWLKRPSEQGGGGVPEANIAWLVSPEPQAPSVDDAHPILDEVLARFRTIKRAILNSPTGRARRLYIFMAGHGISPTPQETVLLMANADSETVGLHVAGYSYAEYFRLNALALEVVLIMDCCRDLMIGVQPNPVLWPNLVMDSSGADVKIFYAFATKWASRSREKEDAGRMRGLFTRALLEGLNNAGNAPGGSITGSYLKNYIHNRLPELCAPDPVQTPDINPGTATSDIEFVRVAAPIPPPEVPIVIQATDGQALHLTLLDSNLQPRDTFDLPVQGSWELSLPQGLYEVDAAGTGRSAIFRALGTEAVHVSV